MQAPDPTSDRRSTAPPPAAPSSRPGPAPPCAAPSPSRPSPAPTPSPGRAPARSAPFRLLAFDLDGTLADTRLDIAASLNHALQGLGVPCLPLETVITYVGDGARILIERALGPSAARAELVQRGLAAFLEHYGSHCLDSSRLYPGAIEVLERLSDRRLAVLTNKPLAPTEALLKGLGVRERFEAVVAGDSYPHKKPDPRGLQELMARFGVSPAETLLIGDSAVDIATARAAGAAIAFASFGFRPEAADAHPVDWRLSSLLDLVDLLDLVEPPRPGPGAVRE